MRQAGEGLGHKETDMPGDSGTTMVLSRTRWTVPVPKFSSENFQLYLNKVQAWKVLSNVPKAEKGLELWYHQPDDHQSDIKEKIREEIGLEKLALEDGVKKFLRVMKDAFKKKDEQMAYEVYLEFFKDMKP